MEIGEEMSVSENMFCDISGMDWMISYIGWKSRSLPSRSNHFSVIAQVTDSFRFPDLEEKISRLKKLRAFLAGSVKRRFPVWIPRWYWGENFGPGILCESVSSEEEGAIRNFLPQGVAVKIRFFPRQKKLSFTFSHAVFDGIGAEKFIAFLLGPEFRDEPPFLRFPPDIPQMKQSGKDLQKIMRQFPEKKILRLPDPGSHTENKFETLFLTREQYQLLASAVERKYGPFSFSIFILALLLCQLERDLFPSEPSKEFVFVPMSVDLRAAQKLENDLFFNRWALMPLLVSRKILASGIPETFKHLRKLYTEALASRTPQTFFQASEAMKYVPFRLIDLFVRMNPARTLGTVMFSFLNSAGAMEGKIRNLYHCPTMPCGNTLGFFANVYDGNFNLVISRRPWKDDGTFLCFRRNLFEKLQEGKV